ncbi:MAG TPA: zf-HC2 domain-containing protein [Terriglobales bacterium]|nr:zf-HC2 domain-containing protein [Terriglobales bacterium]
MNCELWQDKIDAFVDAELPADETRGFDEHLRSCPACAQETFSRQHLKAETRLAGQRYVPSPEFAEQIAQRIAPKRKRSVVWMPALASAAAVLLLAIFVGVAWRERSSQQEVGAQLVNQFVDQHVTTLASDHPVDVASTDRHTVKPWFAGKVPFSVDIPNLEGTGFELIGGRLTYVRQAPAAQLIFGTRKHRISVFMVREGREVASLGNDPSPVRREGFNTQTWVEDGIRYFAISDVNAQDIHRLCDLLKTES